MDEKEWIKRIVAGDTQMFSCLVAKYERMAYTIAFWILGNKEEAEEAVQDAFVRMYRALPRFQFESKFSTWFYRIVYRVAISAVRQQRLFEEVPVETAEAVTPDERDSALELLQDSQRQTIIRELLAQMRPDESLMLTLFYLEECSIEEIHQITSLSNVNIKTKLHRARKHLYEQLKARMGKETNELL